MNECIACGMPLTRPEDCFSGDLNAKSCIHCTNADGSIKPCDEIFEGGVEFFIEATGSSREDAEKLTRKNMNTLPYWKEHGTSCLHGIEATDQEFKEALSKLQH